MSFSIYNILNEEDDEMSTPAETEPTSGEENSGADDDFSIDTSLDDDGAESDPQDAEGSDDGFDDPSSGSDDIGADTGSNGDSSDGDEEPNEANTDMFYSLSTEAQQVKIRELKRLYSSMFNSCNDLIDRLDNIDNDACDILISRLSSVMNDIRDSIADYIIYIFPNKSFIENDTQFNIYMMYINSVSGIMEKINEKIKKE